MRKKIIVATVLSMLSFGVIASNELENKSDENKIEKILENIKSSGITTEDLIDYSKKLKEKTTVGIVEYFNEINSSLDLILENKGFTNEKIINSINSLKKEISQSINEFNAKENQEVLLKSFEDVSVKYVDLIKTYKDELENEIQNLQKK